MSAHVARSLRAPRALLRAGVPLQLVSLVVHEAKGKKRKRPRPRLLRGQAGAASTDSCRHPCPLPEGASALCVRLGALRSLGDRHLKVGLAQLLAAIACRGQVQVHQRGTAYWDTGGGAVERGASTWGCIPSKKLRRSGFCLNISASSSMAVPDSDCMAPHTCCLLECPAGGYGLPTHGKVPNQSCSWHLFIYGSKEEVNSVYLWQQRKGE
jgi:hypothetical protein